MWLAPRSIAWEGVATRDWSPKAAPTGRTPGVTIRHQAQQLTHVVSLHRRAHDAIDAVGLSELCQAGGLLGHGRLDADLAQGILIHAREHGDGDELGAILARLLGTLRQAASMAPEPKP